MFVVSMQSGCTNHRSIGSAQQLSTCPELKEWQESINGYSMVHLGGSVCNYIISDIPGISKDMMFSYLSYLVNHEALLPIIDVMRENQPVQVALLLLDRVCWCLLNIHINRLANPQTIKQILTLAMSGFFYQLWLKWATNIFTNSSCRYL